MQAEKRIYDWEREKRRERRERERRMKRERAEKEAASRLAAKGPMDVPFLVLTLLLVVVGLVAQLSASFPYAAHNANLNYNPLHYFTRHLIFSAMGVTAMLIIGSFNYQRFRAFSNLFLLLAGLFLLLVLIPGIGITRNNATRWLGFNDTLQFQPSEFAKFAVILFFADSISHKRERMESLREVVNPYIIILAVAAGLMMMEPHLSGTVLILSTGVIMLVVGGMQLKWVFAAGGAAAVLGYLVIGKLGYGASRIAMWLDPWKDTSDAGYQMCQSLISIGSGGLFGVGIGRSRQKYLYLPEGQNDFVFSIVCEEVGFIGATLIVCLFIALIMRGFWIALRANDRFGALLTVGIVSLFALQTFLNIAVVTGLVPCTGISLPFFSYGGTALLFQLAEIGVVLSVSRQIRTPKAG